MVKHCERGIYEDIKYKRKKGKERIDQKFIKGRKRRMRGYGRKVKYVLMSLESFKSKRKITFT